MKLRLASLSILLALILAGCSKNSPPPVSSTSAPTFGGTTSATGAKPLPSWNEGPAKQAIINFVKITTDQTSPQFVPPEDRIATFDQDGTLWVEHPMYSQLVFSSDRYSALASQHPEWSTKPLFHGKLINDADAMSKYSGEEFDAIDQATQVAMPVDEFDSLAKTWIATAKHPRFDKLYTELVYEPMLEVMQYLRANGYRTYIVTGGGQIFVRTYSQRVYGVPPEQVIGSALKTEYQYDKDGKPILMRTKSILLNNNNAGKAEDIYLFIGKRPHAAFGNSTGDQQMLEYTQGASGASLEMLVLHDDAQREYAYGPAQGLPDTHIGKFTQALYDEAKTKGWTVISMKSDWNRIFAWEK